MQTFSNDPDDEYWGVKQDFKRKINIRKLKKICNVIIVLEDLIQLPPIKPGSKSKLLHPKQAQNDNLIVALQIDVFSTSLNSYRLFKVDFMMLIS